MKRNILLVMTASLIGVLMYLSSVYLVRAEISLKKLTQGSEKLEAPNNKVIVTEPVKKPVQEPAVNDIYKTPDKAFQSKKNLAPNFHISSASSTSSIPVETLRTVHKEQKPSGQVLISMDFENAKLKDVLKVFCQQSGLNFIAGEKVKLRPITLYLSNVSVHNALDAIIKANGLSYDQAEGSDVFIVRNSLEPELKLKTKIFKLNYALADDRTSTGVDETTQNQKQKGIKEIVKKLLTSNGDLSVDERTNSLIITDIASNFPKIEKAVKDLDAPLPQILIEAKIVELSSADLQQLGIKWTSLGAYTLGLHNPTRTYTNNRTSGRDRTDTYSTATKDSSQNDYVAVSPGTTTETLTLDKDTSYDRALSDKFTHVLSRGDARSAILSADDFEVTLSLLLTDTNIDIISSPNIITVHGREAKITVGQQYPIPQFAYNDKTSTFEVQGFSYKDIGIILRVTPYANKEKKTITLDIHPEVSSVSGSVNFRGIEIPIISSKEVVTNVSIKDGYTLAIGGLLKNEDKASVTKVPILGDIPVLGRLFKHKEKTKTKTNTIIFITAHILKGSKVPITAEANVNIPLTTALGKAPSAKKRKTHKEKAIIKKSKRYQFTHR